MNTIKTYAREIAGVALLYWAVINTWGGFDPEFANRADAAAIYIWPFAGAVFLYDKHTKQGVAAMKARLGIPEDK
jgi:hypothetical protein